MLAATVPGLKKQKSLEIRPLLSVFNDSTSLGAVLTEMTQFLVCHLLGWRSVLMCHWIVQQDFCWLPVHSGIVLSSKYEPWPYITTRHQS